jgi:hypothetical protein
MGKSSGTSALNSRMWLFVAAAVAGIGIFEAISAADLNFYLSGYLALLAAQLGVFVLYWNYRRLKSNRGNLSAIEARREHE